MNAAPLLSALADRGIRLHADGPDLVVRAPRGMLTEADRDALREHKPELLTLLASPRPDRDDWPESWWGDFDLMRAESIRLGYHPGDAARLAYEVLKARAGCPWREEVARWPDERRERWGREAAELQDGGLDWREAEREADEIVRRR